MLYKDVRITNKKEYTEKTVNQIITSLEERLTITPPAKILLENYAREVIKDTSFNTEKMEFRIPIENITNMIYIYIQSEPEAFQIC